MSLCCHQSHLPDRRPKTRRQPAELKSANGRLPSACCIGSYPSPENLYGRYRNFFSRAIERKKKVLNAKPFNRSPFFPRSPSVSSRLIVEPQFPRFWLATVLRVSGQFDKSHRRQAGRQYQFVLFPAARFARETVPSRGFPCD